MYKYFLIIFADVYVVYNNKAIYVHAEQKKVSSRFSLAESQNGKSLEHMQITSIHHNVTSIICPLVGVDPLVVT